MPGGVVTSRVIIIAPMQYVADVNATLMTVDPTSVGDPLSTPLRAVGDLTNTPVAMWCNWPMDNTDKQEFNKAVSGLTRAERTIMTDTTNVPAWGSQRVWLFDGLAVNRFDAWASLGLDGLKILDADR